MVDELASTPKSVRTLATVMLCSKSKMIAWTLDVAQLLDGEDEVEAAKRMIR